MTNNNNNNDGNEEEENLCPLPAAIAAAVQTIAWPLDADQSPAMHFEPLETMILIRAAAANANGSSSSPSSSNDVNVAAALAADVLGTVRMLTLSRETEYTARICTSLLLIGHGYTDEAHDLVSPLSWPRETCFSHGPPIALQSNPEIALAAYTHAVVHRREGLHPSEFGMTGTQNADYWTGAAVRSGGEESLPRLQVQTAVELLAAQHSQEAVEWCREAMDASPDWEPRFLNALCASVLKGERQELASFAEQAAAAELRVLLVHALQMAGFVV